MKQRSFRCLLLFPVFFLAYFPFEKILAMGKGSDPFPINTLANVTNEAQFQEAFYRFAAGLFWWTSFFAGKRNSPEEPLREIYFRIDSGSKLNFAAWLHSNRSVLLHLRSFSKVNRIKGLPIIPDDIFGYIYKHFAADNLQKAADVDAYLLKIIGGDFDFGQGKHYCVSGLIDRVIRYDMNSWVPVKQFIKNFEDTLAMDAHLSQQLGPGLLQMAKKYYIYMDEKSRLRLFRELSRGFKSLQIYGKNISSDVDQLAIRIFQNSGPVMIKLLQQLQEEIPGQSPVAPVIVGLTDSKPLSSSFVEKALRTELEKQFGGKAMDGFRFEKKPLGIASIAQTHRFQFANQEFVAKIQKSKVAGVFALERVFLEKMVSREDVFDKGMKERIISINNAIFKELNFRNEAKNIEKGRFYYTDKSARIETIRVMPLFVAQGGAKEQLVAQGAKEQLVAQGAKEQRHADPEVLMMTLAPGQPLGRIMGREDPDELLAAFTAVQRLYEKFLRTGLNPRTEKGYYHGDLHRENIFFDPESGITTLIDFGNAGELDRNMRESVLKIFRLTGRTQTDDLEEADQAILELGKSLQEFALENLRKQNHKNRSMTEKVLNTYFRACFNPLGTMADKAYESERLEREKRVLEAALSKLERIRSKKSDLLKNDISDKIRDDIDFIRAIMANCLNGPQNYLLSSLASDLHVSEKLNLVFREMQKNGISLPKELIFFNKSKALLEGILMNLYGSLERSGNPPEYVHPDDLFHRAL